jgi:3-deoxy-7-phosphoheptulonate synthase
MMKATFPEVELTPLPSPCELRRDLQLSDDATALVRRTRRSIGRILVGDDPRLLVIVGPCSIHDPGAALEYAGWLRDLGDRYADRLLLVMRAYVEKARTRLGWKGLMHDPRLDGSADIGEGVRVARRLLIDINELGVPVATEVLEPAASPYLSDALSWVAVGARTSASPVHRELVSALPMPAGFKNTVDGSVAVAIDAAIVARQPQRYLGVDADGRTAIVSAPGNPAAHIILRGGAGTNYDAAAVARAVQALRDRGLPGRVVVDCSHGNSRGDHRNQPAVAEALAAQIAGGSQSIAGVMIESSLVAGRQDVAPGRPLRYGQSITDACLDLRDTIVVLARLHQAR